MRNKVFERLSEAQGLAEAKDFAGAAAILSDMIAEDGKRALNSYELANVYNLFAFLSYATEDYAQSLSYYRQVIAQPDIPLALEITTRYTIAQLYFVQEKWQQAIDALLVWFDLNEKPPASAYVLLAQGYYQVKNFDLALKNVETAIVMHEGEGKLPKEQWYNLARFLYFDKEDYRFCAGRAQYPDHLLSQETVLGSGVASLRREKGRTKAVGADGNRLRAGLP